MRYRGPLFKVMLLLFAACFIILGILGVKAPTEGRTLLAQLTMVYYFAFFITMPAWTNPAGCSKLVQYVLCGIYGLLFLVLAFVDLTSGKIYGQSVDGTLISHPSWVVQFVTLAFAVLFFALPRLAARNPILEPPKRLVMKGLELKSALLGAAVVLVLVFIPITAVGATGDYSCDYIECEEMVVDPTDKVSLQSGAKWYMNYCFGCHSLKYSRYERVAQDLEIPESIMLQTLVLGDQRIGELMESPMRETDAKAWFGIAPPDLTLVSRVRSPEWVYTYLKNFYVDPSRPMGVNNRVFPNVGMPHALLELQGLQECAPGPVKAANGGYMQDPLTGELLLMDPCGRFALMQPGQLSTEEFDQVAYDIANFLAYTAEPMLLERKRIGTGVLLFLALLGVLSWLLNREYWRDIH